MIEREYTMENISWKCNEIECVKTGVKLQKLTMFHSPFYTEFHLEDGNLYYAISEQVYNTILKLMKG